ncbi:hypothetical protein BP6252_08383 [Coleophoma cylindrospora]|uniref:Uncharacterized protein n=1 Tax=Coleophoma cylindrospora TaxID=1849047 RepID=A0A3D8R5Q4_9HELO|nr:hypothetical protein BP6252_08383 [Coleophoma cylindrospora]
MVLGTAEEEMQTHGGASRPGEEASSPSDSTKVLAGSSESFNSNPSSDARAQTGETAPRQRESDLRPKNTDENGKETTTPTPRSPRASLPRPGYSSERAGAGSSRRSTLDFAQDPDPPWNPHTRSGGPEVRQEELKRKISGGASEHNLGLGKFPKPDDDKALRELATMEGGGGKKRDRDDSDEDEEKEGKKTRRSHGEV